MPFKFRCPECDRTHNLADEMAGRKIRCQQCRAVVEAPSAEEPEAEEPEAEDFEETEEERRSVPSGKPPAAVRSKLALGVLALTAFGIVATALGAAAVATSPRLVPWSEERMTPSGKEVRSGQRREREPVRFYGGAAVAGLGSLAGLAASGLGVVWFARAWGAVPRRHGGMSAVQAIGLLFVPFFNVYWMFRVIPGLSMAVVKTLQERFPGRKFDAGRGPGLAACVLGLIPVLNLLSPLCLLLWFNTADYAVGQMIASNGKSRPAGDEDEE